VRHVKKCGPETTILSSALSQEQHILHSWAKYEIYSHQRPTRICSALQQLVDRRCRRQPMGGRLGSAGRQHWTAGLGPSGKTVTPDVKDRGRSPSAAACMTHTNITITSFIKASHTTETKLGQENNKNRRGGHRQDGWVLFYMAVKWHSAVVIRK